VIVFVTGTGTEVGKTWVTAAVAARLGAAAYKPVQSFTSGDIHTDAHVLAHATGAAPADVCPLHRWLPVAMAPPMAAAHLGLPRFTIAELAAEVPAGEGLLFIEGAGGLRSPIADDGDSLALADAIHPDLVVLVADAGLGTINLVRLSTDALAAHDTLVYLNRFDERDELHRANRDWLTTREGLEIVTDPEALVERIGASR
jgi:dethiobiotin synthetase